MNLIFRKFIVPLARRLSDRRLARGRLRALWGAAPVLTLPLKARASEMLGFESRSVVFGTHRDTRSFDHDFRRLADGAARFGPGAAAMMDHAILAWALLRFDVFHFFFDRGLMRPTSRYGIRLDELDILKAAGKRVYGFAYGADVRLRERTLALGRRNFCTECPEPGRHCVCDDKSGVPAMLAVCERLTAPVALGSMLAYVPGARDIAYWPIDVSTRTVAAPRTTEGPLRIVHAADNGHFKGTRYLEAAIEKLQAAGHSIEYVKIQGVPDTDVIRLFAQADVVADQFIGGDYGYFALEAMAQGKPVLSYVRDPMSVVVPEHCPLLNAVPETIEETLLWMLANRERLYAIGAQGRAYVSRWHAIESVASRLATCYLETGEFPESVTTKIRNAKSRCERTNSETPSQSAWEHPFRITDPQRLHNRFQTEGVEVTVDRATAIANVGRQPGIRSFLAGDSTAPRNGWTSYDRTPWKHPWLTRGNIATFSEFSRRALMQLSAGARPGGKYAFVGNLANISYMRAAGLVRAGLDIDIYLHPDDTSLMSQPFWEDYEGTLDELGPDPSNRTVSMQLPTRVYRVAKDASWASQLDQPEAAFLNPTHILKYPEYMAYLPMYQRLQAYDATLVSQAFALARLARRPYVVAQSGGDIWFDPARDDSFGRLTLETLRNAYAVLVSNPLTLAHARRYGLKNCLYVPFCIDEQRYHPGDGSDIRDGWAAKVGGDFFVLTSMRLDNQWKGASIALDGFAKFAANAPGARLVLLGWGVDEALVRERLVALGLADKCLLLPVVGKKRLATYLRAADALIEQFVLGYFGASGLEAMASGLPVIMRLEREQYEGLVHAGAPPVLEADSPLTVAGQLSRLYLDPALKKQAGAALREWFMQTHASSAAKETHAALLAAASRNHPINWDASPLTSPMDGDEIEYHSAQLANAPEFPRYEI